MSASGRTEHLWNQQPKYAVNDVTTEDRDGPTDSVTDALSGVVAGAGEIQRQPTANDRKLRGDTPSILGLS